MIATFTDFGPHGPYLGQMEMAVRAVAPSVPVIHLLNDAPVFDPRASAYLLAALLDQTPPETVLLGVVDPGVGGERLPVAIRADGRWMVGPDNGLFELVCRRAKTVEAFAIDWRPEFLSPTFHGRDLFAPVAARLAMGQGAGLRPIALPSRPDWPDDLAQVIYLDWYGNAWTGVRAERVPERMRVGGMELARAETFCAVPLGDAFWHKNSSGLAEIAVNGGRADRLDNVGLGTIVTI